MSTIRDPATITSAGRRMMTAGGDITYTKAVLYGQDISHLTREQLESLTSIGNPLVTVPLGISDKNNNGNGTTVILEATFQNSNLKADLPYTAVGFFAKRGEDAEKLVVVGVATDGAYLAATSPDGVATDALDIKVAIAIGDSANVTAMIDPAGSVTPAALHNAITDVKSEMKTGLDTKADKSTVDSDVKSINDTLATKADKQTVTDDLAKKADKTDVDAQIGTVNKSVSDLSDTVKANKDDADKALATKADKATVESDLATKANQSDLDKTNAEVAKKASTTDVNSQLATKADAKDVTDALALKDDTVDVDKKISNVTKSVSDLSATVTANKKATDSTLATKASQEDLDKTNAVVATKANATALADYARTVDVDADLDTKANKTDLESLAKTADVNSALDTKADKTTVDGDVKTLQASIDTKADKTALDDYAKSADVASDVKNLTDSIATKADAQTVSDAISKIDLTPFAKTADVNSALSDKADKATIDAINKALATKRNITDSYSRDELDKKFLELSADTDGKVNADQVAKLIAGKADQDDVDKKIKAVTDAVNTKANSSDVTSLVNTNTDKLIQAINAITYSAKERPLPSNDANEITEDGIYRVGLNPLKNGAGQQWDFLLVKKWDENTIYQMMYGGGKGIFIRNISKTVNSYPEWTRIDIDVNDLQNTLNAKANTADVNSALSDKADKATIDAINKALATKRNITDSYSRDELDKKFLELSADTDGKVNADQVAQMIAGKADKDAVDKQIEAVTDSVATKANSDDVYSKTEANNLITDAKNTGKQAQATADSALAGYNKRPVISGGASDDLLSFKTTQLRYYPGNGNTCKNLPPATNRRWFTVEYIFENPYGDGIAIYRSPANEIWTIGNNGGAYDHAWVKVANANDIQGLQNQINTKADTATVNSQVADAKNAATKAQDTANQANTNISKIDLSPYAKSADVNSKLQGYTNTADLTKLLDVKANTGDVTALQNKVNVNTPLFREISADSTWEGIFGVTNPNNVLTSLRINPGGDGQLVNDFAAGIGFGGNDTKAVITVDCGLHVARFTAGNGTAPSWSEDVAFKSDINSTNQTVSALQQTIRTLNDTLSSANATIKTLQDTITKQATTITGLQTQVNNQAQDIAYIKANYIEGKRFSKADESQATAWEKENPQRIAFIEDK